ncbi:transposase-like protein [Sinorhizobium meliloti]|nr:transposase-like protein [Sinorhizobium meliloti]
MLSNPDGLREVIRTVMQEVLEAEMDEALGAAKGERTPDRLGYRSGHYGRTLITRVGKLELRVPQDRSGHFSTELFERYQRSERALVAVLPSVLVMVAFLPGNQVTFNSERDEQPTFSLLIETAR